MKLRSSCLVEKQKGQKEGMTFYALL
jgi:hypothetical protein